MKSFFSQYSYSMIKMFINQFAISIFGSVLSLAASAANNKGLSMVLGVFAIAFYLFLIYTMTWEIGAKDRISVDVGKKPACPHTGLLLSLIANIPNFLIAILYACVYPIMGSVVWAGSLSSILMTVAMFLEGMYCGLALEIVLPSGFNLWHYWWTFFLIIIPALITAWGAYFAGYKNFRMVARFFDKRATDTHK